MVRNSELLQKSGNVIWTDLDRFKEQLAEKEKCVQHGKTHIKAHYYIEDSSQFKRTTETSSAASSILTTQTLGCEHINANTKEQGTKTHILYTHQPLSNLMDEGSKLKNFLFEKVYH